MDRVFWMTKETADLYVASFGGLATGIDGLNSADCPGYGYYTNYIHTWIDQNGIECVRMMGGDYLPCCDVFPR